MVFNQHYEAPEATFRFLTQYIALTTRNIEHYNMQYNMPYNM